MRLGNDLNKGEEFDVNISGEMEMETDMETLRLRVKLLK
jgi:hypothetical protein